MFAIISSLALAAASPNMPAKHSARGTPPSGSVDGLFKGDDYPPDALDNNLQGDVGVLVKIDASGAISDCIVDKSSGAASLDARTCDVIRARARFKPALDAHGEPIASEVRHTITWRIADDIPEPSDPWTSTVIMTYSPDGVPQGCVVQIEGAKSVPNSKAPSCSPMPIPERLLPLGRIRMIQIEQQLAAQSVPAPPLHAGDMLLGRAELALDIDAKGKVSACSILDATAELRERDVCMLASGRSFVPHKGPTGDAIPVHAVFVFSNMVHIDDTAPQPARP